MNRPKVGIGVLLFNDDGHVLLGKRVNAHGAQTWSPPGGHLEYGETWEACAMRELHEETGIIVPGACFLGVTNDIFTEEQKHYVSIFMGARCVAGQVPQICEPDKIAVWRWFSLHALPAPLFLPLQQFVHHLNRPIEPEK